MPVTLDPACPDAWLVEVLRKMDALYGSRKGYLKGLVDDAMHAITNLNDGLTREKVEEVVQLVKNRDFVPTQDILRRRIPNISIREVKDILKLINGREDRSYFKNAIEFVRYIQLEFKADAYKFLYAEVNASNIVNDECDCEMLFLQQEISKCSRVPAKIKAQLDDDCSMVIERIVIKIKAKDYSAINEIAETIDKQAFEKILSHIVDNFFDSDIESTTLLIEFSQELHEPFNILNKCYLVEAIVRNLMEHELMESEQAMLLWAHVLHVWTNMSLQTKKKFVGKSMKKLEFAFNKLSPFSNKYFEIYQTYVENPDKQRLHALHQNNHHLKSILPNFTSFYYNGDLNKAYYLIMASRQISRHATVGSMLIRLHEEMTKRDQLNTFEAVRIFNEARQRSLQNGKNVIRSMQTLKEKAPMCLKQLLWPEGTNEFQLVNKSLNCILCVDNLGVACSKRGRYLANDVWSITVDPDTSLLNITCVQQNLQLTQGSDSSVCLGQSEAEWKVSAVDQLHIKIFGNFGFLTAEDLVKGEYVCNSRVNLMRENDENKQLWKLMPIVSQ